MIISRNWLEMNRAIVFFMFMGVFIIAFSIGAETRMSEQDTRLFLEDFNKLISDIKNNNFWFGIFFNNVKIALPMFIPGFGVGWGVFSAFSTGTTFSALTQDNLMLANFPPLAVFLSPFGIMELTAYSIGIFRSFLLATKLIGKISIKNDWKKISIEIGIVVGLLLIGGIIEAYLIEMMSQS